MTVPAMPRIGQTVRGDAMRIAVVGGGASGVLAAAALLRQSRVPLAITVFEPRAKLGQGVAYSTRDRLHLLNVPACGMSALPDDPGHFVRWAGCEPTDFLPRSDYGRYLAEFLDHALRGSVPGCSITHQRDRIAALGATSTTWVRTDSGDVADFDVAVLATGHGQPVVPRPLLDAAISPERLLTDPWSRDLRDVVGDGETVLVVGTGLTFVDVSVTLASHATRIQVEAISHHGLVPHAHSDPWQPAHPAPDWMPGEVDLRSIVRYLRGFGADWRRGVDSLRPLTARLWQSASEGERDEFTCRLARFWDVHRHRMAPAVARTLADLIELGRVRVHAATIAAAEEIDDTVIVRFCDGSVMRADRIVVCTGPCGDPSAHPLGKHLIGSGLAAPGPLRAGFDVAPDTGALLGNAGASRSVYAIGPLRRGVLWESTAIPEIRRQAVDLAAAVLHRPAVAA